MKPNMHTTQDTPIYTTEWKGMAQEVLKNSDLSDHPALSRLQVHAQENPENGMDIGCYSRMHHRHNR